MFFKIMCTHRLMIRVDLDCILDKIEEASPTNEPEGFRAIRQSLGDQIQIRKSANLNYVIIHMTSLSQRVAFTVESALKLLKSHSAYNSRVSTSNNCAVLKRQKNGLLS